MAENALKSRRNKSFLDGKGKICYRGGEVIDMTIPQNLKDLRRLSGMTQEQVAEKVGLTRQAISSYESGRTQPDLAMLEKLAEVYGVEITDVLYGAAPRQQRLRLLRRLALGFAVTVLGLLLLRSAVRLWANTFLAFPDGTIITEATKPLLEQRFAIGDFCEGLESLAGTVSLLGCLILGAVMAFVKPLPPAKTVVWAFLAFLAAAGAITVPFALLDGLYQPIDYYLPVELMVLPPVVLLLLWWGILALVRRKKDRSAL